VRRKWEGPRRTDRWTEVGLGVRYGGESVRDTRSVGRVINNKVVDLLILYHFHKGRMAFFSTIFAQIGCQASCFLGACE
jgi:hypothetical protein